MNEIVTAACVMNCLKTSDCVDLFYTKLAEFPGLIITVFLVLLFEIFAVSVVLTARDKGKRF